MRRGALFSDCGLYRYRLTREWDDRPPLVFVMLNPSRADAEVDDPTIRRCIGFAHDLGFGGMTALNLFALRTPHPAELKTATDPVGPENDAHLEALVHAGGTIIAAWGTHGALRGRDLAFRNLAQSADKELLSLGRTRAGQPRHPLYIKAGKPLEPFPIDI